MRGAGEASSESLRLDLRRLRLATLLEGSTLIALVGVAVPLKHLAGLPIATSWMGPLHGMAFLVYVWTLLDVAAAGRWPWRDVGRGLLLALVPFGAFLGAHALRQRELRSLRPTEGGIAP